MLNETSGDSKWSHRSPDYTVFHYGHTFISLWPSPYPFSFIPHWRQLTGHTWNSKEAGERWKGKKPGSLLLLHWYVASHYRLAINKLKVAVRCIYSGRDIAGKSAWRPRLQFWACLTHLCSHFITTSLSFLN